MSTGPRLRPQPAAVPTAAPTAVSAPYWDGCAVGRLRYQRCTRCGSIPPEPVRRCLRCGGTTLAWERSSGQGRLYSWTVVWRPPQPVFEVPYAPAVVALDEGWWMLSAVIGCAPDDLRPDLPLAVEFHPANDRITLPYFRPG